MFLKSCLGSFWAIVFCACLSVPATRVSAQSFALVELFTSQGCSSCPSADNLLGRLIAEQSKLPNAPTLVALSFHVDYWNRLGWRDPFSQAAFSDRQREYATRIRGSSTYTPQAVVNGQWETVGSNEATLRTDIQRAFRTTATTSVAVTNAPKLQLAHLADINTKQHTATLHYACQNTTAAAKSWQLHLAVVERKAVTHVGTGENGGAVLTNYNIVRTFTTLRPQMGSDNIIRLELPEGYSAGGYGVVGFLQDTTTNSVVAVSVL